MTDYTELRKQIKEWEKTLTEEDIKRIDDNYNEAMISIRKRRKKEENKKKEEEHKRQQLEKKIKEYKEEQKLELLKKETEARFKKATKIEIEIRKQVAITKNKNRSRDIKTYLMKDNHNNLYKIGYSNNPKLRERTLQSEKPSIKMVKVWDCDIEKKLHKLYDEFRVRGEWFNLSKIQVRYICTHF
jgi:hypothetical protein